MKDLLVKLFKKSINLVFIVICLNIIKFAYSSAFVNKTDIKAVNVSKITSVNDNKKTLLGGTSAELAKGKVIIQILSVDARDNALTIKLEIENNSEYLVGKSPYNFHLIDSAKKKIELKPTDNNSLEGDILPNSKQVFILVFSNVNLSSKPMNLKGELFIPEPRIRDDRFSLDINY